MNAHWRVRRTVSAQDAGQQRWDLAYQCLLRWVEDDSGPRCGETDGQDGDILDDAVWQGLCRVIADLALLAHEVHRAHSGAWLPQALQAQQQTVRAAVAPLERQQERLLAAYLAEIIDRDEFARKRQEILQTLNGLAQQLRQMEAQAQQQHDVAAVAHGLTDFCQRLQPTLDHLTFDQRRQLVELLIDRVIVDDGQVEIRYVILTGPKGAETPFCHLRLDYLHLPPQDEPGHDPDSVRVEVGVEEGLGRKGVGGIADEDPADRDGR